MGQLVEGKWHDVWYDTKSTGGHFKRMESQFRNWVTPNGEAGPHGKGGFAAEPNRYHLYVSLACPWAHRTLLMRALKGLDQLIPVSVVHPLMLDITGKEGSWDNSLKANGMTFGMTPNPPAAISNAWNHSFAIG